MKTIKTVAVVSVLVFGMTTSAFASWWNPLTWHWFKKNVSVVEQQVIKQDSLPVAGNIEQKEDRKVEEVKNREEVEKNEITSNIFTYPGIEVGQKYGVMTVEKVTAFKDKICTDESCKTKKDYPVSKDNLKVTFIGTTTLIGVYNGFADGIGPIKSISRLTSDSLNKIPKSSIGGGFGSFGIDGDKNDEIIKKAGIAHGDKVEVAISRYYYSSYPSEVWDTADIVGIKKYNPVTENKNEMTIVTNDGGVTFGGGTILFAKDSGGKKWTVDYRDVKFYETLIRNGQESSRSGDFDIWLKQHKEISSPNYNGPGIPGVVKITGTLDNVGVIRVSKIIQHVQ